MSFKSDFLFPYRRYQGKFKPENLVFNANLQEFSQRVSYISNLESSGKLSPEDSLQRNQIALEEAKTLQKAPQYWCAPSLDRGLIPMIKLSLASAG